MTPKKEIYAPRNSTFILTINGKIKLSLAVYKIQKYFINTSFHTLISNANLSRNQADEKHVIYQDVVFLKTVDSY